MPRMFNDVNGSFLFEFTIYSLSHGYQTPTKKISAVSAFYEVLPYRLNEVWLVCVYDQSTGLIGYEIVSFKYSV